MKKQIKLIIPKGNYCYLLIAPTQAYRFEQNETAIRVYTASKFKIQHTLVNASIYISNHTVHQIVNIPFFFCHYQILLPKTPN